ncbi:MAG: hypothetical protein DI527_21640 [Chelatococcus sp.]|nr:MAG: hypothetical protein DI527_21640 [Chelatococcus sp.]
MTSLPDGFYLARLELAREPGHPEGSRHDGYEIVMPLDHRGHIDADAWRANKDKCRVRRFTEDGEVRAGHLARKPGGAWYIDYRKDVADEEDAFHFNEERFVIGEYASIRDEDGKMHTYRIVSVESV